MKAGNSWTHLAAVTASQWGMITTAQAARAGISRLRLARWVDAGYLERLAHGVYRDAGTPVDQFEDLRAAWLSTDPKRTAEERLSDQGDGVIVAGASAALVHGLGDMWADHHAFVTPHRRQTQRPTIRYRQRHLDPRDITIIDGLPVMTRERTIVDLLDDGGEISLVADAFGAALKSGSLDLERLGDLLAPLAQRHGFPSHDGGGVVHHLLHLEGLDMASLSRRLIADLGASSPALQAYNDAVMETLKKAGLVDWSDPMEKLLGEALQDVKEHALASIPSYPVVNDQFWRAFQTFNAMSSKGEQEKVPSPLPMDAPSLHSRQLMKPAPSAGSPATRPASES